MADWKRQLEMIRDFMTKELMGFSNYGVKIFLDFVKILQIAFFYNYGVKILLD